MFLYLEVIIFCHNFSFLPSVFCAPKSIYVVFFIQYLGVFIYSLESLKFLNHVIFRGSQFFFIQCYKFLA
jgi:hypothetical protein